ncbi:MAG: hypothetical protein ACHQ5A_15140, partial [Opitutales bacterium]
PRNLPSLKAAWPSLLGALIPLAFCVVLIAVLENPNTLWQGGLPCRAVGFVGGWGGAWWARRATAVPTSAEAVSGGPGHRCLLMGMALLMVAMFIVLLGVVPPLQEGTARGFNNESNVLALRVTAVLELLAAIGLAIAVWRTDLTVRPPKALLGPVAFCALLLGLVDSGLGAVFAGPPALRHAAVWLWLGAAANLAAAAMVTATSVFDDRRGAAPTDLEPHPPPVGAPPVSPAAG